MTKRIDGKARADRLLADIAAATAKLKAQSAIVPGLCAVLVGDDPASEVYVRNKGKAAVAAGIASFQETLPATITEAALLGLIGKLKKMCRVYPTAAAKTFAARMEAGAAKTQFVDKPKKPFTDLLAFVAAVLVREKSDLITIHVALLTAILAPDTTRARLWS